MCNDCGCIETAETSIDGEQQPAKVHHLSHEISLKKAILSKNDTVARHNREHFQKREIFCSNWISAPGSGKTRLLERLVSEKHFSFPVSVIEGDQATENDALRIRQAGARAIQINTGSACHLDAEMIHKALHKLDPQDRSLVMIENVGNMVCPTAFDLGEHIKVALISTPEGEDKPVKYPDLILTADCLVINKIDLIPYLDFNLDVCLKGVQKLKPTLPVFPLSASTGEGVIDFANWLEKQASQTQMYKEVS